MSKRFALVLSMLACACGVTAPEGTEAGEAAEVEASSSALTITGSTGTSALKCRNVSYRWQICGSASRTKWMLGVGIRFYREDPNGTLTAASGEHETCAAALADTSVPQAVRDGARTQCGRMFAETYSYTGRGNRLLFTPAGAQLSYTALTPAQRAAVDRATLDLTASQPGPYTLGCATGPGPNEISCWGFGYMCSAWVDEDGEAGAQCSKCDIADCW